MSAGWLRRSRILNRSDYKRNNNTSITKTPPSPSSLISTQPNSTGLYCIIQIYLCPSYNSFTNYVASTHTSWFVAFPAPEQVASLLTRSLILRTLWPQLVNLIRNTNQLAHLANLLIVPLGRKVVQHDIRRQDHPPRSRHHRQRLL